MRAAALDQRLEALAGPPAFRAAQPTQGTFPRSPFDGFTLIVVYDATGTAVDGYPTTVYIGRAIDTGRVSVRFQSGTALASRFDTLNGANNQTAALSGGLQPGRHIASVRIPDGLASLTLALDGASTTRATTPGDGITDNGWAAVDQPGIWSVVDVMAWPRHLTDPEMLLVTHHLATRHGIPL